VSTPSPDQFDRWPNAAADDAPLPVAEFVVPGIRADAARGVAWVGEGWALFKQVPLTWILIMLILFGINMVVGFIPLIGGMLGYLIGPLLTVGVLAFARELDHGRDAELNQLFIGFQTKDKMWPLVGVGGLYLVTLMVIVVIAMIIIGVMVIAGGGAQALASAAAATTEQQTLQAVMDLMTHNNLGLWIMLVILIMVALMMLAAMIFWFVPGLVFYANVSLMDAVWESFAALCRNWLSLLVYSVVVLVVALVACIPLGLGLFVAIPVLMASNYACFRDIFGRRPDEFGMAAPQQI
jgi:uncharacterized membrane protein